MLISPYSRGLSSPFPVCLISSGNLLNTELLLFLFVLFIFSKLHVAAITLFCSFAVDDLSLFCLGSLLSSAS